MNLNLRTVSDPILPEATAHGARQPTMHSGLTATWASAWRLDPTRKAARGRRLGARVGRARGVVTACVTTQWRTRGAVMADRQQCAAGKHQWDPGVAPGRLWRDGSHRLDTATARCSDTRWCPRRRRGQQRYR
jgi:hypothetical protein